jgi:hypothetical protein
LDGELHPDAAVDGMREHAERVARIRLLARMHFSTGDTASRPRQMQSTTRNTHQAHLHRCFTESDPPAKRRHFDNG